MMEGELTATSKSQSDEVIIFGLWMPPPTSLGTTKVHLNPNQCLDNFLPYLMGWGHNRKKMSSPLRFGFNLVCALHEFLNF